MKVSDVMTRQVLTVSPDTPVEQIIRVLSGQAISGLPVVEGDRLVGIVSEGDLVAREKPIHMPAAVAFLGQMILVESTHRTWEEFRRHAGMTAGQIMTRDVVTIGPDTPIEEAARIMIDRDLKRLPVLDQGKLVGIVTRKDLIRSLL